MKVKYVCPDCGHEVMSTSGRVPSTIYWSDGHSCYFEEVPSLVQLNNRLQSLENKIGDVMDMLQIQHPDIDVETRIRNLEEKLFLKNHADGSD